MPTLLESELRQRRLRPIPGAWRSEILLACQQARPHHPLATTNSRRRAISVWRRVFWPHPAAWASLAAVWVCLFLTNRHFTAPLPGAPTSPPPDGYWAAHRDRLRDVQTEIAAFNAPRGHLPPQSPVKESPSRLNLDVLP